MFTVTELNILRSALRNWKGPFGSNQSKLNEFELRRVDYELQVANQLADRSEEILNHYYQMENSHL